MKKILSVALILLVICVFGCGNEKSVEQSAPDTEKAIAKVIAEKKELPPEPPIHKITRAEATTKLNELSTGLNVRVDDMKELTFCHCPIDYDAHPPISIVPYVTFDKNYNVDLYQDIVYVGREVLYFDTLYIKTSGGVDTFRYEKTVKSVDGGYVGEEYVGKMTDSLYRKLQSAIKEGGAKFRFEGRSFAEREFTKKELSDMTRVFAIYEFLKSVKVEN